MHSSRQSPSAHTLSRKKWKSPNKYAIALIVFLFNFLILQSENVVLFLSSLSSDLLLLHPSRLTKPVFAPKSDETSTMCSSFRNNMQGNISEKLVNITEFVIRAFSNKLPLTHMVAFTFKSDCQNQLSFQSIQKLLRLVSRCTLGPNGK